MLEMNILFQQSGTDSLKVAFNLNCHFTFLSFDMNLPRIILLMHYSNFLP